VSRHRKTPELIETAAELLSQYRQIVKMKLSKTQLCAYAEAHGYKPGWVWHRLQEQGQ
jgi:hypothetical protein